MKSLLSKRFYLNLPQSLMAVTIFSIFYLFAALYAQPGSVSDTIRSFNQSGIWIYLLNWLPIFLCAGFIYFSFNNCALAVSLTGVVFGTLSVANYLKIKLRQAPLWPWDLVLGGEVAGIAKSFSTTMIVMIVALIASMIVFIAASVVFVRNKPLAAQVRIIGAAAFMLVFYMCNSHAYAKKTLYENAYVNGNRYNEVNQYNSRGFIYSFVHAMASTKIEKPTGYDKQAAKDYLDAAAIDAGILNEQKKPHILMIMSEAFSDIALNPELDFSGYTEPLAFYKELKQQSLNGYIVVPNVGGGTADTEFDVLTAINTRHYRGVPYTFNLLTRPVASLASELSKIGYANIAIHPGYGWFYNRTSAYPKMGFDKFIHLSDFGADTPTKGVYVDETSTIDRVIKEFETHLSFSDGPLFEFCVTIQNHGPYEDKYAASKDAVAPNFETDIDLTAPQLNTLYNYFLGLADADRELRRLVDYLEASSEPVMLVYFGDHLPSFDYDVYEKLLPAGEPGFDDGETKLYRTPFFIWQNAAAEQLRSISPNMLTNDVISSSYLGAVVLRILGLNEVSAYFDFAAQVSDEYPVVLETRYADADGRIYADGEPEELELLRKLEYYRFFSDF